jgi:hypothetical protein
LHHITLVNALTKMLIFEPSSNFLFTFGPGQFDQLINSEPHSLSTFGPSLKTNSCLGA